MSWIELSTQKMVIVTGDGRSYEPLWKPTNEVTEFNVSQFEFPGVEGSIVSRGTPKGRKFPLELAFVGPDHLDEKERFRISSHDKRHWVITHPYYGVLNVQPITMDIDHSGGNVSMMRISVIETIVEDNPKGVDVPSDIIIQNAAVAIDVFSATVVANMPSPTTLDRNVMQRNVDAIYNEGRRNIPGASDAENYLNLYNEATAGVLNATSDVSQAMTTIQTMINAPFQFADTVRNRVNSLRNQFDRLVGSVESIANLFTRPTEKMLYEHNAGSIIGTIAQASVTNIDYKNAGEVVSVAEILIAVYDQYIENIDTLQSDNGAVENAYIPNVESMIQLQEVVNYTISKLLEIALDSKRERSIVTEKDTNVIMLAHRLYGLQPDDSTIDYLIDTNDLGMDDLLQIPVGRKIKYYV
jgi:hypothetical protein